jgi:hypothetical protein
LNGAHRSLCHTATPRATGSGKVADAFVARKAIWVKMPALSAGSRVRGSGGVASAAPYILCKKVAP